MTLEDILEAVIKLIMQVIADILKGMGNEFF
jgi:hypothetical protein